MAASPFNAVKLELGIALALAVVVMLATPLVTASSALQLVLLLGYGIAAMLWLVARTRRILCRQAQVRDARTGSHCMNALGNG